MRQVPRADVQEMLAKRPVFKSTCMGGTNSESKSNNGDLKKELLNSETRKLRGSYRHLPEYITRPWDLTAYKSFARIGELRNDTDLVRAGLAVGDQAVVGDELINSVPMASLRLGESPRWLIDPALTESRNNALSSSVQIDATTGSPRYEWRDKPSVPTPSIEGLAFFRIKVPLQVPEGTSLDSLGGITRNLDAREPPSTQPPSVRRGTSGIVRNRKRRLGDVLNSFN